MSKKIMITLNDNVYSELLKIKEKANIPLATVAVMLISQKIQIDKENAEFKKELPIAFKELAKNQKFIDMISEKIQQ